jgi:hypothetical protein
MTYSALTNQIRLSPQCSGRNGDTIDTILWHHQAGTNDDWTINAMVTGAKEVSANYTISNEGRLTLVVDESMRAWTSGSTTDGGKGAAWDRRAITIEVENMNTAPGWEKSDAAYRTAAALSVDLRRRYRIVNELGHRDLYQNWKASYPTYCPGPEFVARVRSLAGTVTSIPATPAPAPAAPAPAPLVGPIIHSGIDWAYRRPQGALAQRVARALIGKGRLPRDYNNDGDPREIFDKAVQTTLSVSGKFVGFIDGDIRRGGCYGIQDYGIAFGDYSGIRDGRPEGLSWGAFALGLERP